MPPGLGLHTPEASSARQARLRRRKPSRGGRACPTAPGSEALRQDCRGRYRCGCCPCAGAAAGGGGRRQRRLRSKHLLECLIGALLVRISAANSNRANQLIVHNDRQTAGNEVVGKALGLAEVQAESAGHRRC